MTTDTKKGFDFAIGALMATAVAYSLYGILCTWDHIGLEIAAEAWSPTKNYSRTVLGGLKVYKDYETGAEYLATEAGHLIKREKVEAK